MTEVPFNLELSQIDPERLSRLLQESGWVVVGGRRSVYVRLTPPSESSAVSDRSPRQPTILIPLDREAPEFADSLLAALSDVEWLSNGRALSALAVKLSPAPTDAFRFRKESAAPSGLIPWSQGERLIASARASLVAGAKSHMEKLRYYSNRYGQFAGRYMNTVLMGQTAPGSYVVTAFAPAAAAISLSGSTRQPDLFGGVPNATSGRDVTLSVVQAFSATLEALQHFRATASMSAFEDLVPEGVSYEMVAALEDLALDSSEASIFVEWDPVVPLPRDAPVARRFEINGADAEVFHRAAVQLATSDEEAQRVTVVGRVHLLSKREAGGPGVIGLDNLASERPQKARVRLVNDEYHRAVRAHDEDLAVVVAGRLEREGNVNWLYDARLVEILGPVEELARSASVALVSDVEGQMDIGDELGWSTGEQ